MNREQYRQSLIDKGLDSFAIAQALERYDQQTAGGQGGVDQDAGRMSDPMEIDGDSPQEQVDNSDQSLSQKDMEDISRKLPLMSNPKYKELAEKLKNKDFQTFMDQSRIEKEMEDMVNNYWDAKENKGFNDQKEARDLDKALQDQAQRKKDWITDYLTNGKDLPPRYQNLSQEQIEAEAQKEYDKIYNDDELQAHFTANGKGGNMFRDYRAKESALTNIKTARQGNTLSSFIGEEEEIELNNKVEKEILNTLSTKDAYKFAGETDEDFQHGFFGGDSFKLDNVVNLKEKEQLITQAKQNVLIREAGLIEDSLEGIMADPNLTKEQKKEKIQEAEEKFNLLSAELDFNQVDKLFANNFEMTEDYKDWQRKKLDEPGANLKNLVQGLGKGVGQLTAGTSMFLVNVADTALGLMGGGMNYDPRTGKIGTSEESTVYSRQDYLNDVFKDVLTDRNYMGVAESPDFEKNLFSAESWRGENIGRTLSDMLPFSLLVIQQMRKGNFKEVAKMFGKPAKMKAFGKTLQLTQGTVNGMFAASKMTALDNYFEGLELGLDQTKAVAYSSIKSGGTGLSQAIMPDANILFGSAGKVAFSTLANNLKSAATKEGIKNVGKQFVSKNILELMEEETDMAFGDLAKYSVGLRENYDLFNAKAQHELLYGTAILTNTLGIGGIKGDFNAGKEAIYNAYRNKNIDVLNGFKETIAAAENKMKRARSPQRKKYWKEHINQLKKGAQYGTDIYKAINVSPETVTSAQIDLLIEKEQLLRKKEGKDPAFTKRIDQRINDINERIEQSDVVQGRAEIEKRTTENVGKLAEQLGISFDVLQDTKAVKEKIKEVNKTLSGDQKIKIKQSTDQGFIIQDPKTGKQQIIINKEVATKDRAITVAQHELLHGAMLQTLNQNPGAAEGLAKALGSQLLKLDPALVADNSFLTKRLEQYKKAPESVQAEELLTAFSDGLSQGYFKLENEGMFQPVFDAVRRTLSAAGVKAKFNTGKDVLNFIKDFNRSVKKNNFDKGLMRTIQEGAKVSENLIEAKDEYGNQVTKSSKQVEDEINMMGRPENFESEKVIGDMYSRGLLDGLIKSKIPVDKPPGFSQEDFIASTIAELVPHIRSFNPEINDSLSGWINSQLSNKIGNVFKKGTAGTKAKFEQEIDQGARQVADVSENVDEVAKTGTSKFRKQLGIKQDLIDKVKNSVIKTFGTKLPEINSKKFIQELKKRYRVELKPAIAKLMGTRQAYKDFLVKNKKSLMENMPISTLVRIERNVKPEDRIFTTEVKRNMSPTEVDEAIEKGTLPKDTNRLSGPTLYKKKMPTDKQFLDFYTGNEVAPSKRGTRKDALAEEIGVELAFDATMEVVQSPDVVAKRQALNELLGREEAENSTAIIAKQINRDPNIKFSKGSKGDILLETLTNNGIDGRLEQEGVLDRFLNNNEQFKKDSPLIYNIIENALIESIPEAKKEGEGYVAAIKKALPFLGKVKSMQTYWVKPDPDSSSVLSKEGIKMMEDHTDNYIFDMIDKGMLPKELLSLQISKTGATRGSFISAFFKFDNRALGNARKQEFKDRLENAPSYKDIPGPLGKYWSDFFSNGKIGKDGIFRDSFEPANSKKLGPTEIGIINKIGMNPDLTRDQKIKRIDNFMKTNTEGASVMNSLRNFDLAINMAKQNWLDTMPNREKGLEYIHRDNQANTNEVMSDRALAPFTSMYLIDGAQDFVFKGEHVIDQAAKGTMTTAAIYEGKYAERFYDTTKGFEQSLGPKAELDVLDKMLGKNSPLGDMRFAYDLELARNTYDFTQGRSKLDQILDEKNFKSKVSRDLAIKRMQDVRSAWEANSDLTTKSSISEQMDDLAMYDSAREQALDPNKKRKGISVFDFDDTLARTKSKVKAKMKDGSTIELDATEFAAKAEQIADQVAEFDFSDFNKVIGGTKGPLFELAQKRQGKFGNKDIFILTARPQASANAIQTFLKGLGLDIKLENITGLENGTPKAKADWILNKVADGYNDFYFADDAYKNVKAVQDVLNIVDVKSDVQQAIVKSSKKLDSEFNMIIEQTTGELSIKEYSDAAARSRGEQIGRFKWFLPPSAQDFEGLIYSFLGKGKVGDKQLEWFNEKLFKPFSKAMNDINNARQSLSNDFRALKKHYPNVRKKLGKKTDYANFTFDQAIRVYNWNKAGHKIPGISKTDLKELNKIIKGDPELQAFADQLSAITKVKEGYPAPEENWIVGNTSTDMHNITMKVGRAKYLKEWKRNKDVIFSKKNMNKIEAIYGTRFREALEDVLYRMENGTNRTFGQNRVTNAFQNWINNSVGAIMFFNTRSAILQTISAANYINFGDNNPLKAGMAFANQPQFWSDFSMLFNSDMLKQRRSGLQSDINEAEIANAVAGSKNKAAAAISYLLKKGFLPTQLADSFAIASGGASMFRNRFNTYKKQGLSDAEAKKKAFQDFQELTERNQQSSRPDRISMQQASSLGRLILAFQNTPMQYTREIQKSFKDLINGRGDWKTNMSKIAYYGAVQNLLFTSLQNALFGLMFNDEDDEDIDWDAKKGRTLNSMSDTILRGGGVYGAGVSTIKNVILKFLQQEGKGNPDHAYTIIEALNLSPPIGSKIRKLYSSTQAWKYDKKQMKERGFGLDNPAWLATGNVVSATTNIPLDRLVTKINNMKEAVDSQHQAWQRIAMAMGWTTWDVGVDPYEETKPLNPFRRQLPKRKKREINTRRRKLPQRRKK
tara:strand:+ start:18452 stop:26575 length:8124 start_codon:yes stop_codon:yes gene_type:complete